MPTPYFIPMKAQALIPKQYSLLANSSVNIISA